MTLWGLVLAMTNPHRLKPVLLNPRNGFEDFLYDGCPMFRRKRFRLHLRSRTLILGERTLVMGVLNITPDSFSDGGKYLDSETAIARGLQLEQDGADILDIGGESTRPGATPITAEEELRRILPVIQVLRGKLRIPMSVDTRRADVAEAALAAGAEILNDVSGLRMDLRLGEVARRARAPLILMHMRGTPRDDAARSLRARRHP